MYIQIPVGAAWDANIASNSIALSLKVKINCKRNNLLQCTSLAFNHWETQQGCLFFSWVLILALGLTLFTFFSGWETRNGSFTLVSRSFIFCLLTNCSQHCIFTANWQIFFVLSSCFTPFSVTLLSTWKKVAIQPCKCQQISLTG